MQNMLAENYGLEGATLTPFASGMMNQNFRVEAGGRLYALKRYTPDQYSPDEARRSAGTQAMAAAAGLPVPAVISNRRGDLITETPSGICLLTAFAAGRQYDRGRLPATAARSMGLVHGRLLDLLAGIQPVEPYALPDPAAVTACIERLIPAAERGREPADEVAQTVLRQKLAAVSRLSSRTAGLQESPVQWVHGDYQETNIIFDEDDQVAAVLDFDNLRCRPRGHDVMRAFALCFPMGIPEAYDYFAGFTEGAAGLSRTEVIRYAPAWTYVSACNLWPISARYEEPGTYQSRWDRFIRPMSGWWEAHKDEVTERLLALTR